MRLRGLWARVRALFRSEAIHREIAEEVRFHLDMRTEENVRRGMSPDEARREAERRFGRVTRIREQGYEVRGGRWLESFWQDCRYGARSLRKSPGFTAAALVTLALGIGVNTTIFSVVNAVLLRPLPYAGAERLVQVSWALTNGMGDSVTGGAYAFWKEHQRSFEEAAGYTTTGSGFNLSGGDEPVRVRGLRASEGFLRVLGVSPALGRGFTREEDTPGGPCAAVIGDGLWRGYFGGDPAAVGRRVELNGQSCTVVGVLPADFRFEVPAEVLLPLQLKVYATDQGRNTEMIARLAGGVTLAQAQAEADALFPEFKNAYPKLISKMDRGVKLVPYGEAVVGDAGRVLYLLSGAVGFVLLIACANVANLLLARGARRRGEIAVRIALGAGRWRLVRQLLTESFLLALAGGAVGLVVALWGVPLVAELGPGHLPRMGEVGLDAQAVLFALAASALTSLLFGVAPALQATRVSVGGALKSAGGGRAGLRGGRARSVLIVAEVALSLVLLVGAGLLVRSLLTLRAVELGFDPRGLTTMQVSLNSARYRDTAQTWELQRRVLERVRAVPGVVAAASVPSLPLERGLNNYLALDGPEGRQGASVESRAVSPDYFRTLGIALLRGRALSEADAQGAQPVVVVNEALARRLFPDRDPLGAQVYIDKSFRQIVGVASDIREKGPALPPTPTVYVPAPQVSDGMTVSTSRWFLTSWIVRTSGDVDVGAALREALREADPQLPVANIRPMTEVVSASVAPQRFVTTLMASFALLALALTAVGLYGLLSYQVSQRTHEIGLRMALGARAGDVLRMIIRHGMGLTAAGLGLGLVAALALARLLSSFLYGVTATDPTTYAAIAGVLGGVSLLACYLPARRATKVDPIVALRYE